jgi:hypothetical protein
MSTPSPFVLRLTMAAALLAAVCAPTADAQRTEAEPVLRTETLVQGRMPLTGIGYRIARDTPVRDYMGRYRLETDIGVVEATGIDELAQRVDELPAARRLLALERSDAFGSALANSAKNTGQAVVRVVTQPVETITALPLGIGRAISAAGRRVRAVALQVGDASRRGETIEAETAVADQDEAAEAAEVEVIDFAKELAGVNKARRQIAKDLGIDPYTRNPLVAEKLGQLAWASVAGGLSLDLALSAVPSELRDAIGTANSIDNLAWDLPLTDIRHRLERELRDRGHSGFNAREFLRNPAFSPTDQLAFVELLGRLGLRDGEGEVLAAATAAPRTAHAQFMLRQMRLLLASSTNDPMRSIHSTSGLVWELNQRNEPVLPLAIDHLAWNGDLAKSIESSGRLTRGRGHVLVAGGVSRLASSRLQSLGWDVRPRAPLAP